jgi:hypothetical protein
MVLVQLSIYWSDLLAANAGAGALTSLTPITVSNQVNLYGGKYKAKIVGWQCYSGHHTANHPLPAAQLINISSSKFLFRGNGEQGMWFSNTWCGDSSIGGVREFEINTISGTIDLTLSIQQFGTAAVDTPPYVNFNAGTWTQAEFAYVLLTLEINPDDNTKALFGQIKC